MREHCIYCKTPFVKAKNSKEHLIPEGIGGQLSKKFLLCKDCNDLLSKYDEALQEHLAIFLSLKGIKGKRELVSAKGESNYGKLKFINGKPIVKGKVIDNLNGTRTIQGDKKYTTEILEGLKKKDPNIKVIKREPRVLDSIRLKLIDPYVWKGIGKILYLFAHYFNGSYIPKTDFFKKFLSQPEENVPFNCPLVWVNKDVEESLILPEEVDKNPLDCILVIIDYHNEENCIIGYVSFFGIRYIGLIDDSYEGDSKLLGYFINVKNKVSAEFCSKNSLNISREVLTESIENWLIEESLSMFKEQYSQAFQDAKLSRDVEDAFSSAAEKTGLKDGELINEEWLENFMKEFMDSDTIKNIIDHCQRSNKEKKSL